jgi:hypothetical protein
MKALLVLLMFSISATAQMNEAGLLKLDREFAKATSEKRLDGWMRYMMDSTVVFGPLTQPSESWVPFAPMLTFLSRVLWIYLDQSIDPEK